MLTYLVADNNGDKGNLCYRVFGGVPTVQVEHGHGHCLHVSLCRSLGVAAEVI